MDFEWDEEKAASNLKKHGISFPLARYVFADDRRIERPDDREEYQEERWLTVGRIAVREVAVVFTIREGKIRIISARKADLNEREEYWRNS